MKKILLIPIILASSLTTGCNFQKAPKISLNEWLTDIEEEAFTYFSVKERNNNQYEKTSYRDYEYKVADIIKNNSSSKRLTKITPNVKGDHFVYNLNRDIGNYYSLFLMVYENCIIFSSYGEDENGRINEHAEYAISEKDSKAIFEGVNARYEEMNKLYKDTNAKAEEETTIDSFYAELDKEKDNAYLYCGDKEIKDADLNLLEDIKDFEFTKIESNYEIEYGNNRVMYGIKGEYIMEIGKVSTKDYYGARLIRYFYNPANPYYKQFPNAVVDTYLVSNEKVSAFLEKANTL